MKTMMLSLLSLLLSVGAGAQPKTGMLKEKRRLEEPYARGRHCMPS